MSPRDFAALQDSEALLRDAGHTHMTMTFEQFRALIALAWKGKAASK